VDLGFDRQGWITVFAALLLALITLYGLRPTASHELRPCRPPGSRFRRSTAASRNSLHRCRLGDGRRAASWHPTIAKGVQPYELEQRILQMRRENARLAELNSKLDAILFSSDTSSTPPSATPGESET